MFKKIFHVRSLLKKKGNDRTQEVEPEPLGIQKGFCSPREIMKCKNDSNRDCQQECDNGCQS